MFSQTLLQKPQDEEKRLRRLRAYHARKARQLREVEEWIPNLDEFKRMLVLYNLDR